MAISPSDVLNKNKNLKKRVDIDKINLDDVTIDDLKFNGKNYDNYINSVNSIDFKDNRQKEYFEKFIPKITI